MSDWELDPKTIIQAAHDFSFEQSPQVWEDMRRYAVDHLHMIQSVLPQHGYALGKADYWDAEKHAFYEADAIIYPNGESVINGGHGDRDYTLEEQWFNAWRHYELGLPKAARDE